MSLALEFDAAIGRLAMNAVVGYQRYLSPYKGFACAHRALHGGPSCSQHVKQVLADEGLIAGLRALRPRFRACRDAARAIREGHPPRTLAMAASREFDEEFDLPPEKAEKGPRPGAGSAGCCEMVNPLDCLLGVPSDAQCCHSPDLSGCDASGMDCGVVGIDCGGCG